MMYYETGEAVGNDSGRWIDYATIRMFVDESDV